jgi:hypothetical protein
MATPKQPPHDEPPRELPHEPPDSPPLNSPDQPAETVVEEQRRRSEEIEAMGVEKWKAAHDERVRDQKPEAVPGVSKK